MLSPTAPPPPKTWNKEYQEQSTEYLKEQNSNPIVRRCLLGYHVVANVPVRYLLGGLQGQGYGYGLNIGDWSYPSVAERNRERMNRICIAVRPRAGVSRQRDGEWEREEGGSASVASIRSGRMEGWRVATWDQRWRSGRMEGSGSRSGKEIAQSSA